MSSWRLFWHIVETCFSILGYLWLWDIAASCVSAADSLLLVVGLVLFVLLIAAPVVVGRIIYQRLAFHLSKE